MVQFFYMKTILIILSFFIYTFLNASSLEKVSLQLQWLDQFQFAGYYIAKEKGFYKDVGLDVELLKYDNSINQVNEVLEGRATFSIGRSSLIIGKSKKEDTVLLSAIFQTSPSVLLTTKSSNIKTIQDFVGKNIMITNDVIDSAMLNAMMQSEGIDMSDLKKQKHSFKVQDLINKKTDLMSSYISNEPFRLKEYGYEPVVFDPKEYGFDAYSDILFTSVEEVKNNPERTKKFIDASHKGWDYAFSHIDETVDLILRKYNSQNKSAEALSYEALELKKLAYYKTDELGFIDLNKIQRIYDIYNVLGLVKEEININEFVFKPKNRFILTNEEKLWIKENPVVSYSEVNWKPLSIIENSEMNGIMGDYLKLVSQKTGIKFKFIPSDSWPHVLEQFKDKKIDLVPGIGSSPQEKNLGLVSDIYATYPMVIVTGRKYQFIKSLESLNGQTIAVPKDYTSYNFLKQNYPNIKIISTKSISEALLLVQNGEADAFIGHVATSLYYISKLNLSDLKISGTTSFRFNHHYLIQKDNLEFLSIINKAFKSISEKEKANIYSSWIKTRVEKEIEYKIDWQVVILFIIILLIILILYFKQLKLKKLVEEQKETFENLFRKSTDGISLIKNNKFIDCNDAVVKLLKYSSKEKFLNSHPSEFSPVYQPDGRPSYEKSEEMINLAMTKGSHRFEWVYTKLNGEDFWVEIVLTKINMGSESIIHVVWRDISDRKILEDEILKMNRNLELRVEEEVIKNLEKDKHLFQQSRLAQMGEMISMIAHQWRQPLSAIASTASDMKVQIALEKYDLSSEKKANECALHFSDRLSNIELYVQSLTQTINDFRNFYKPNKESITTFIYEPLAKAINIVKPSFTSDGIEFIKDYKSNKKVVMHENEIMQVILNILKNSQDNFIENNMKNRKITVRTYDENDSAILDFLDNGGGIDESIIDKIFDPYYSTKNEKNGTGLGLYMSKIIIEEHHNGKLEVENIEDGVRFRIKF